MSIVVAVLVRVVAMGAALAGYYAAIPYLFPDDGGGANIGAGLIAFGALVLISFGWAFVDGTARGISPTIATWAIDASTSASEIITHDLGTLPFTLGLVLVPAAVGAVIGTAFRPARLDT